MNTHFQRDSVQKSDEFCMIHNEQKIVMFGRTQCETCCKQAIERGNAEHDKAVNIMVREKHFSGAMLPHRHSESGFKNYDVQHDGHKVAKAECFKFAKNFVVQNATNNLIMVGRTGTGKTHLACAVARNALDARKYVRYVTSEDMAGEISSAWSKPDDSEASAIYRFTDCDLLILDEYGLHDQHETRLQLVHKVLYARYDAKKATMLITNWTVEQLKENLGDRLWSRFQHDGLTVVDCNWSDNRVGGEV